MTRSAGEPINRVHPLLFRVAFARARPCYCYGCICLTPEEQTYERRVFRLAHAWGKEAKRVRQTQKSQPQSASQDSEGGQGA